MTYKKEHKISPQSVALAPQPKKFSEGLALLVWLAAVEMQSHLVGLFVLMFVVTDPYFPAIGVFPYFQHCPGDPGGCDGTLGTDLPSPLGWGVKESFY